MNRTALAFLLFACACTRMDQYFDGKVVQVDGREFLVRQLSTGSYQAVPNSPKPTWHVDAAVWGQNVKAIESVTGCRVDLTTIKNTNSNTIAAVDC